MLGSEVLDVAIGLTFIYLVLSLVSSAINEFFEMLLKNRPASLEEGIKQLLGGKDAVELVKQVYNHPLISGLFPGEYDRLNRSNLPAYIPSGSFAMALMDIISPASPEGTLNSATPAEKSAAQVARIRAALATVVLPAQTKRALTTILDSAQDDAAKLKKGIEDWFNTAMDRVAGAYKRKTQFFILIIGVVLAIVINGDSISIVNTLATDKAVRESLINAATEAAKSVTPPAATDAPKPPEQLAGIQDKLKQIRSTGLPLGWSMDARADNPRGIPGDINDWISKIAGLLLTAFAVSIGAPFWFDVLNKIIVVRSTVKPKEKSQEEASKD